MLNWKGRIVEAVLFAATLGTPGVPQRERFEDAEHHRGEPCAPVRNRPVIVLASHHLVTLICHKMVISVYRFQHQGKPCSRILVAPRAGA